MINIVLIPLQYGARAPAQTAPEPPGIAFRGIGRRANPGQSVKHALGDNAPIRKTNVTAKDGLVRCKNLRHRRDCKICAQIVDDTAPREWILRKAGQS